MHIELTDDGKKLKLSNPQKRAVQAVKAAFGVAAKITSDPAARLEFEHGARAAARLLAEDPPQRAS